MGNVSDASLDGNLNQGNGGTPIYLCAKYRRYTDSRINGLPGAGMSDIRISTSESCGTGLGLDDGVQYHPVGRFQDDIGTDVNRNACWFFATCPRHICWKPATTTNYITNIKLTEANCPDGYVKAPGIQSDNPRASGNLNEGNEGKRIFLCVSHARRDR